MKLKKEHFKNFNSTKYGKKMLILGIVGIILIIIGGFFAGYFETDDMNEIVSIVMELIPILGGYFFGMYIGTLLHYLYNVSNEENSN